MKITNMRALGGLAGALVLVGCAVTESAEQVEDPTPERYLEGLSLEERIALVEELRIGFSRDLLTPAPELLEQHPDLAEAEGVHINRILNRGVFDGVTLERGGGAYFSFTSFTNDYNQDPDLELQQWYFTSGFAGGDWGHVVRLEAGSLEEVALDDLPAELRADVPPPRARGSREEVQVGAVYAVRSIRLDQSDLLVALEVLQRDEYGVTFAWRPLAEFAVPTRG